MNPTIAKYREALADEGDCCIAIHVLRADLAALLDIADVAADFTLLSYGDPHRDAAALFKDCQDRDRTALARLNGDKA